ncbi:hypothetical protein Lser_V15G22433 [Lactuca serriola]
MQKSRTIFGCGGSASIGEKSVTTPEIWYPPPSSI